MLKYFRVVLYTITGFFLFIFVYITFFSDQYRGLQNAVSHDTLGGYTINFQEGIKEKKQIDDFDTHLKDSFVSENLSEEIIMDKRTILNTYYISHEGTEQYERDIQKSNEEILLGAGEYYLNFEDPTKTYSISSPDFKIDILSTGKLYIKNSDRRIGFYSFDGIFKIHFKDIYTGEYTSSFYIFPGMYGKGSKFRKQPGVDESALVVNELFYINNLQLTGKKKKLDSDSNVVMHSFNFIYNPDQTYATNGITLELKKILGTTTDFLDNAILQEREEKEKFKKHYKHFEELKNYSTPLFGDLKKYFSIFLNKSKKVIYYKNLILVDISALVNNVDDATKLKKVVDTESEEHIENILKNLKNLKDISHEEYETMKSFLDDFYYFYKYVYISDFSTKHHVENLFMMIHGHTSEVEKNDEYLSHIYALYNARELSQLELNTGLMKYIVSSSRILDPENERSFYYYYYAYNKILKNHIQSLGVKREGFEDIIRISENISFINEGYFQSNQVKKGMLYINAEIIENIMNYLSSLYFEEERDGDNLLVLKDNDINIDDSIILNLEKNIQNLYVYQKDADVLDKNNENEGALLQKYKRFKIESDEYFEAIINNDDYKNAKILNALDKISGNNKTVFEKPSVASAKKYLNDFTQVDTKNAIIEVIGESYYEIGNIKVANETMSFDIYPLEFHKITNIKKAAPAIEYLSDILLTSSENEFSLQKGATITVDKLYNYLIDLGNIEVYKEGIQIENGIYYKLKNINVGGVKYSFSLFPKSENKVTNVMEGLGVTYKLDNIKPNKNTGDVVRATEEYQNFFVDLVSKTNQAEKELVNIGGLKKKDSIEVNIFKNDFLFGDNGDFSNISDKMNLRFDNVNVTFENRKYETFLDKISMRAPSKFPRTDRGENSKASVNAEYVISEVRSYFKKMSVQFYFLRDSEEEARYDFAKQKLQILGNINIEDFDVFYENLWEDYKKISIIHGIKQKIIGDTSVSNFRYSPSSREAILSYPYKGATMTITFKEGKVYQMKYKEELFEGAELRNIENVFKLFL